LWIAAAEEGRSWLFTLGGAGQEREGGGAGGESSAYVNLRGNTGRNKGRWKGDA